MKRNRANAFGQQYQNRQFKKPRRTGNYAGVARAYPGSKVPLASRGYRLNTAEKKVYDIDASTVSADTTGSIVACCFPVLGTDMTNRVGRKIQIKSIQGRGIVRTERSELMTAAATPAQMVRYIILVDMQPNGALPALTDILKTAHPASPLNLNNRDRFKILLDKQWALDPYYLNTTATTAAASMNNQCKVFKYYKKCNVETIFNGTNGGTIADITSGAVLRVILGNQAVDADDTAEITSSVRVRFTDV